MSDKAAAELIGTAILLFTIQVSVGQNAQPLLQLPSVAFWSRSFLQEGEYCDMHHWNDVESDGR